MFGQCFLPGPQIGDPRCTQCSTVENRIRRALSLRRESFCRGWVEVGVHARQTKHFLREGEPGTLSRVGEMKESICTIANEQQQPACQVTRAGWGAHLVVDDTQLLALAPQAQHSFHEVPRLAAAARE